MGFIQIIVAHTIDNLVKSHNNMSFRGKWEILPMQDAENTRFLLAVEMTGSPNTTFYETITIDSENPQICRIAEIYTSYNV